MITRHMRTHTRYELQESTSIDEVVTNVVADDQGGGDRMPALRATREGEVRGVWDYVVVELMAGGSLADLLRRKSRGAFPWRARLALC